MQAFLERGYALRSGTQVRQPRTAVQAAEPVGETPGASTAPPRTSSRLRGGRAAPPPRRSLLDDPSGVLGSGATTIQKSPAAM